MKRFLSAWFSAVAVALVLAGAVVAFLDLHMLPVRNQILLPWATGMLGGTMMGWGLTALYVARYAFAHEAPELLKAVLLGLMLWFVVDTGISAYLGVYLNCIINAILLLAAVPPLVRGIRELSVPA